jgi:hypothetical protein
MQKLTLTTFSFTNRKWSLSTSEGFFCFKSRLEWKKATDQQNYFFKNLLRFLIIIFATVQVRISFGIIQF